MRTGVKAWVCQVATFLFSVFHDSLTDVFIHVNFESNSLMLEKGWDVIFSGRGLWSREDCLLKHSVSALPRALHLFLLYSNLNFLDVGVAEML